MLPSRSRDGGAGNAAFVLLHIGFVATGVVTTLLGPILPSLSTRWSLTDTQAGWLFTAQFAGSMLGVALSGRAISKLNFRNALAAAFAFMGSGVAMLALLSWPLASAATFTYGVGLGLAIPATNLCVSDLNPDRRAAALNILNLAWGAGAVLAPPLVALFQGYSSAQRLLLMLAGILGAFAWAVLATFPQMPSHSQPSSNRRERIPISSVASFAVLAAIFYLYVGTESAVAGWIASFAKRVGKSGSSLWLLAPSFMWAALLSGRAASAIILRRVGEIKVAIVGLLLATAGVAMLVVSRTDKAVFIAAILAGCGLAPVYPIAIALLSHRFGAASPRVAPVLFGLASVGGATLPLTVGAVSTHFGDLRAGLSIPLVTTVLMLVLYACLSRTGAAGEQQSAVAPALPSEVS